MTLIRLLDGLQDAFVYPEADGDREQSQADVGADADDAAHRQGEEQQEGGAEHHARGLDVAPVQKVHHCRKSTKPASRCECVTAERLHMLHPKICVFIT